MLEAHYTQKSKYRTFYLDARGVFVGLCVGLLNCVHVCLYVRCLCMLGCCVCVLSCVRLCLLSCVGWIVCGAIEWCLYVSVGGCSVLCLCVTVRVRG